MDNRLNKHKINPYKWLQAKSRKNSYFGHQPYNCQKMYTNSLTDTTKIINSVPYNKMHSHQPPVQRFWSLEGIHPPKSAWRVHSSVVAGRVMSSGRKYPRSAAWSTPCCLDASGLEVQMPAVLSWSGFQRLIRNVIRREHCEAAASCRRALGERSPLSRKALQRRPS